MIAVLAIFGYIMHASKKIRDLTEEIGRLSDQIAVYEEATKEIDISIIKTEIQNIGELAAVEYLYTDAGKYEDSAELFGKEIPLSITKKSFVAKWNGSIKAGIDISKITVEINKGKKEIMIHIPEAEILSHEIDEDSIETLDEKNGLFNKIKVEDVRKFEVVSKEMMEKRAIENGLLDKAFENAKEIIYRLVDTDLVEELEYTITFEIIES